MKRTNCKRNTQVTIHPELRRNLLANPTHESLSTIIEYQLLDQPCQPLLNDILYLLPYWEQQACEGNIVLATLIQHLLQHSPHFIKKEALIQANLLRIRILASTPGAVSFPPSEIQEHLVHFLRTADVLADLPAFEVLSFTKEEINPLASDLMHHLLTPHSRRYIQNLFYDERREAILAVLAHIAKLYPIINTSRQAYALMLSLDNPNIWSKHPFCLRLIANRFWDFKLKEM
ncbi:MAG: hypothetical protein Q8911_16790, partial [Bacillota bacterium]|nr:hypothetical protein [Bacillota bacterium]